MSEQDVRVVRASFDAYAAEGLEGLARCWHPDIDWRAIEGAPDDVGEIRGHEAMLRYLNDWVELFDDIRLEAEEFIDAGDRVVVVQRVTGRAKVSGIETELRFAVVYTVRDGKIARGREYATRDEALRAAGLTE